ncbi:hypothetical protein LY78DRAFT_59741 [Colletotrichum sublineola]|nr:hypothetical protein LY78DRAFT_59741 [Colletotrichum sublineola]
MTGGTAITDQSHSLCSQCPPSSLCPASWRNPADKTPQPADAAVRPSKLLYLGLRHNPKTPAYRCRATHRTRERGCVCRRLMPALAQPTSTDLALEA